MFIFPSGCDFPFTSGATSPCVSSDAVGITMLSAKRNANNASVTVTPGTPSRSPSLQVIGVPAQTPPEQTSFTVQALPSLQATVLLVCTQAPATQESSVQILLSLQSNAVPAQTPPEQTSFTVQALLSLQLVPLAAVGLLHTPVAVSQVPAVWH